MFVEFSCVAVNARASSTRRRACRTASSASRSAPAGAAGPALSGPIAASLAFRSACRLATTSSARTSPSFSSAAKSQRCDLFF